MLENDLHKIVINKCLCFFGEGGGGGGGGKGVCKGGRERGEGGGKKKQPTFHNSLADKNNKL